MSREHNNMTLRAKRAATSLLLLFALSLSAWSQGIEVRTKDGQTTRYRYHDIESIVTYDSELPYVCEAVDLGLSVQWASCNIGAATPHESGLYFAWGETETKKTFTHNNSAFYTSDYGILQQDGVINGEGVLLPDHDVANIIWGEGWRTPTSDEQKELMEQCEWEWDDETCGYRVTGPNGNSIFLPAAGYCRENHVFGRGDVGYIWSSTAHNDYGGACSLFFHSDNVEWNDDARYYGHCVRPVIASCPPSETDEECRSLR